MLALVTALLPAAPALAANPWLGQRVLNMAHQGGEDENPSNTMYALRRSLALGADMLELDVHATKDGHVVAMHDSGVARTTNGTGSVYDMTLAQIQALDSAYNFVPGRNAVSGLPASSYPFRGVRTGQKPPPPGFRAEDFRIPTLDEILAAFPGVPLNVEIKGRSDTNTASFLGNAEKLAAVLKPSGRTDVIVVSFSQQAVDHFHTLAPTVPLAPGITGNALFVAGLPAGPGVVALQVPPVLAGITIVTPDYVRRAHAAGYAVHVWFSGTEESERVYNQMLDMGVDGLMPAEPTKLEQLLCERAAPRPAGNPNHCGEGVAAKAGCAIKAVALGRATRAGRVRVRLTRGPTTYLGCEGSVALAAGRSSLGRRGFTLPAGARSVTATVKLTARGRRLAARKRGAKVRTVVRVSERSEVARSTFRLRAAR